MSTTEQAVGRLKGLREGREAPDIRRCKSGKATQCDATLITHLNYIPHYIPYQCIFTQETMVEANTIRGCLLTYGVDCDITRNYLTGGQVGLATAQAFVEMGSDAQSGVMKGLAEASRDKNYGAQPNQDGTIPFVSTTSLTCLPRSCLASRRRARLESGCTVGELDVPASVHVHGQCRSLCKRSEPNGDLIRHRSKSRVPLEAQPGSSRTESTWNLYVLF